MCFYAYKNVLEPVGHLGANLIFSILTLNQVREMGSEARASLSSPRSLASAHRFGRAPAHVPAQLNVGT